MTASMPESASERAIEARTQELGRALLDAARGYRPGPAERVEDWLLTHAVADERFRGRLLRYMDVLAALDYDSGGREAKRLAHEYFADEFPDLPASLRWLLRIARNDLVPAPVVGETARRSAELFARRFITPPGTDTVNRTIEALAEHGRTPSFDLLGEAVLSESEARAYVERYHQLIAQLSAHPAARTRTAGGVAALQVSLKLSSLTSHFTPVDPAGTVARVRGPLEELAGLARAAGIGLTVDMEQYGYRALTVEVFRTVFARGSHLGDWPDAGIVLQSYLRDSTTHAAEYAAFARERGTPFQVRLVKGAYWDYETIVAAANRWTPPVWTAKAATDASYERTLGVLLDAHPALFVAVGSHNARAHAFAEAAAEARGLPAGAVEHQTLFRTAEGTSRGLAELGWQARDYVPVGELIPGMAYLVRRVLENSSQAGFLLQSRSGADVEELLRAPDASERGDASEVTADGSGFVRMPEARWFDPEFRAGFEAALASTRARWGTRYELRLGDEVVDASDRGAVEEVVAIYSPSYPATDNDTPPRTLTPTLSQDGRGGQKVVSLVPLASKGTAERAAELVREGSMAWGARSASERAEVLRRAADDLETRAHEFAAWVVHEGGRDRDGAYAEVVEAVDYLRLYAQRAETLFAEHGTHIAPRGAVAVVPPWNFSLAIPCGMTSAALATGNGVVLKPAGQTPTVAYHLVAALHAAGVPREALVWLPGRGSSAGQALVESPDISMVAFTGSRGVGTRMHEDVARVELRDGAHGGVKALLAEMGGKNPVLVFPDADLDEAVEGILKSAFGHANQKCSAASRVLVAQEVYARLSERLVEAARSLHLGPADEPGTQVNPVIDRGAYERLLREAATAREECTVLLDRFEGTPGTLELGPLIVETTAERATSLHTFNEELFGPILILVPFEDTEQAVWLANATAYGLTAGVFSRSPETIAEVTERIEAGTVYVNRTTTGARVGIEPFGGMYMSGTGPKAGGPDYLWAFVRRTDTPADAPGDLADVQAAGAVPTAVEELHDRWWLEVEERIEIIEDAATQLEAVAHADGAQLRAVATAARTDLASVAPTVQAAGQHTELRYDVPRGKLLLHARGAEAAAWLGAALLAGNAVACFDSARLASLVRTLHGAGVPRAVLAHVEGGAPALLGACAAASVAGAATDGGPAVAAALYRALGPTAEGQRGLKALLSRLDGPQPGEAGFLQRFAHPRVVAVRTLRHGADLAIEGAGEAPRTP